MKRIFRVLAIVAVTSIGLLVAAVSAGLYLNARAEERAALLCASIKVGTAEADAIALGKSKASRYFQTSEGHRFFFQGWVFNGSECVVQADAGKVVSAKAVTIED